MEGGRTGGLGQGVEGLQLLLPEAKKLSHHKDPSLHLSEVCEKMFPNL